jgi:peroxiredoxin
MRRASFAMAAAACAAALLLAGCGSRSAPAAPPLASGPWRATLALPGGELPFGLEIGEASGKPVAWLINGADRVRVTEISRQGDTFTLRMPGFENRIVATLAAGELKGELVMIKSGAKEQHIPFAARPGLRWRFFDPGNLPPGPAGATAAPTTPTPATATAAPAGATQDTLIAGRWAVVFDDAGKISRAVGEFQQAGNIVTGTFLTPTGDHRYLAGELREGELWLSKFDGGHAFLYRARLGADGSLAGTYWSGLKHSETFTALRDENATLGDAENATRMKRDADALDFRFPDLGGTYVSLSDPYFRGKVVIVALAGSWCPNCHDEAAFLAPLYRRLRARGLEVISLQFEQFGDFARAAEATHRFRDRYGIDYTTLIAGVSDKDDAASKLPQLNGVFAFPTTLLVDRRGIVRHIHTGFSGPATGEHYTKLTADLGARIEQLLAEPTPEPAPAAAH